ncbi:MAG: hypothetical protein H7196_01450 [candidate division SR1 bacterium]|nr:hypothetical protein [candidate division SR1 bacterium]
MKKERIFLFITFVLPIIFVSSIWGYYSYYNGKINPKYDFVYVAPYNNPYFGTKDNKPIIYNPFEIKDDGELKLNNCEEFKQKNSDNLMKKVAGSSDDQMLNNCSMILPKDLTYYRFDIKTKTSKQIDFDIVKSTKFINGFESPDGYTFSGDISSQLDFSNIYNNPFTSNTAKFSNATLTNKTSTNISFELKENPYNRLFIGWIKVN